MMFRSKKTGDWGGLAILALALVTISVAVSQSSAEPGKGALLGVSPQENDLLSIQYPRGRSFPLFGLGFPAAAIGIDVNTQDATTDVAFLGRGVGGSTIYRADLPLVSVALLGNTGLGSTSVHGMDFMSLDATTDAYSFPATDAAGQPVKGVLYAALNLTGEADSGGDHLAILNQSTGIATPVGPFGIDGIEALAFDADGTLWAGTSTRSGASAGLYTVDTQNGLATFYAALDNVGPNGPPGPPSGGLTALTFGCDGTLWGGTAQAIRNAVASPLGDALGRGAVGGRGVGNAGQQNLEDLGSVATDGGRLLLIDPSTGFFRYAPRQSVRDGDLGGLTFDQPCLTLFAPTPGLSNALNELLLIGASPNSPQRIFAGFSAGNTRVSIPGCGNMDLGIQNARPRGAEISDDFGEATFEMFFPRGFSGRTLFFQVVDRRSCTMSNVGAYRLP